MCPAIVEYCFNAFELGSTIFDNFTKYDLSAKVKEKIEPYIIYYK